MQGSIFDYWQAIVGLVAILGVYIAWQQWRKQGPTTINKITHGDRNQQQGGIADTENTIEHGDDNIQKG